MAVYTPVSMIGPTGLTTGVASYSSPASATTIARTVTANALAAAMTFTYAITADALQTDIIAAYALTANVPAIFNGWWAHNTGSSSTAHNLKSATTATQSVVGQLSGYTFS